MSKKLTRRKKLIIGIAVPLLVLVIVACVFLFGGKKGATPVKPEDSISICLTPPSSGAPSEYGGLENIGYIAGKLRLQPYYHSEMNGSVDAMVTQEVHGYKDYKDGIYIASSISIAHSSLAPSKALQKFFGDGKAVIRTAASDDEDDWNGAKTKWSTGEPNEILTRAQYEEKYGMWGNELTDYIINSETLLSCSTPQKGADGIYTMTAELDPVKSTYYYTHQMLTMGELSEHPKFESIRLTFRFREDWTLLSYDIHEKYETYVSVITAECEAKMTIAYSYEESKVDVSAYDNYFKKYANAAPVVLPEPEKGAREYLTAAFGPLLGGEKCIDFTANVNENVVAGKIALDISLGESIAFNGLQINLGNLQAGLVGNDIVVQYKDFNGKFPLETLLSYLGAGAAETPAIDAEALLGDLMNAPIVKDGDKSSISATLALGDFPIHIAFYFNEGTEITLEKIEASLELEGMPISLTATLGEKTDFVELDAENAIDVSPFVQDILAIIAGKNYAISVNYANADFAIAGEVVINAQSGLAVGAELSISVNGGEIPVSVVYKDETVYVSCKGLQVKGTLDEISGLIARFVPQTASEVELDTATLVDALLKANYDKLLKSLSLTENSVGIVIDGNELLTVLSAIVGEVEFELGDITLGYARESKTFAASVLGVELGMTATEKVVAVPENADTYVTVTEVVALVEEIISVIETKNYAISVNYANADFAIAGEVVINAQSGLAVGAELVLSVNGGEIPVNVVYKDETVYVSCKGLQVKGTLDEISGLIARFVPQTASEVELDTATLVDALLKANYDKLLKSLSLTENSVGIVIDGNELLTVLSAIVGEVEIELGDITLGYARESKTFAASVLGVELGMTATEKAVEIPVNASAYVSVTEVVALVEEIISVIETKNYAISVNYANADFAIAGEVVINAQSGIAVGADITISVNGGEIPVSVVYKDETVYVSCKGLQVKGTLDEISGLIARFVPQTASEVELDTAALVDALLKANYDKLLKSLSLTENSVGIVIDGNELLGVLETIVGEVEFELGDITLGYASETQSFAASVLGVELGMTATEKVVEIPVNATEYVSVTEIAQFIDPIMALTQAQNIGFGAALKTEIEGISLGVSLSGYVTLGEEISLYVQADVTVNEYAERLEIYYKEGGITVVYGGVALVVPENEISLIAETLTKLLGGQESALMVLTEDSVDIVAILESVKLYSESEGLGAFIKLSALLDMDISDLTASLSVKENWLFVKTDSLAIEGFAMQDVQLSIGALETVSEPDFAEVPVCTNVLEFALGAYRAFADTEYLGLDVAYASDELKLSIGGVVQFKAEENSTASIISMDVGVVIETYAYNEENGAYEAKENHFLHATILNEQLWASYSLKEIDAPTAVYVTLPVSELFVAGGKILPILAPMLGISEDVYYYDFVVKILSGAYKSFTTDIIDTMTLGEWLSLIEGIIAEQSATPAAAEETTQETSFVWTKDENGDTVVAINAQDVTVSLTMLKNAATELVAPSAPEGKSYLDISSIATLLTDVLNAYDYKDDGYALSGSLALSVGSWNLKNIQLSLQIQAVEKFALYANLVPKSGTVTQLAIEDGYVYMKRVVQSTETKLEGWKLVKYNVTTTEYRAMTMAQFSEDMMEQIYFILNLSSLEKGIIDSAMKNAGSSGGDTTSSQYDAGDMVKGFVYTPATDDKKANYKVTLNLGAILNDSAFGDVNAVITREQLAGKDYYDLTKIDATVGISVLSFNLSLTHDSAINPSSLDLSKIGTHKAEALSGLEYADFNALYAAVENGIVSKSSQVKVKA